MAQLSEPSAKGSLVLGAVVTVRRTRSEGRVTQDALAARLSGAALELLEQKIDIGRWYPVRAFTELLDAEWEICGRRDPEHMRRQGTQTADRLFQSGIYQQLRFAEETSKARTANDLTRQAKLITTITGSLYNFLSFEVRIAGSEGDRLEIVYGNAALFSEALRYSTEGFMNQINVRQGSSQLWSSQRPKADLVVFSMRLPQRMRDDSQATKSPGGE